MESVSFEMPVNSGGFINATCVNLIILLRLLIDKINDN